MGAEGAEGPEAESDVPRQVERRPSTERDGRHRVERLAHVGEGLPQADGEQDDSGDHRVVEVAVRVACQRRLLSGVRLDQPALGDDRHDVEVGPPERRDGGDPEQAPRSTSPAFSAKFDLRSESRAPTLRGRSSRSGRTARRSARGARRNSSLPNRSGVDQSIRIARIHTEVRAPPSSSPATISIAEPRRRPGASFRIASRLYASSVAPGAPHVQDQLHRANEEVASAEEHAAGRRTPPGCSATRSPSRPSPRTCRAG